MPSLRFNQGSIAAGGSVTNVLSGSKFEFLPSPAVVSVFGVTATAGMQMELTFGNVIECDQMEIPVLAAASGGPNRSDHLLASGVAAAGDRIVLKLTNVSAGAIVDTRLLVDIKPL